ncbi:MAG: C1 family peptidase [Candidatus Auribacterota bacterium]|uniref:Cysteine protease n=1 Tax=Candidatus Auribacter fodinae TaxID=2093366 RepID=A0A3A4RHK5_9BACT|nr:MAG: cysteine protease [Candidatus Auribacter fodinae]
MKPLKHGMGWLPDYPDFRDYTTQSDEIKPLLLKTGMKEGDEKYLPSSADLRQWCPAVEDQESLGSCTANAGVGILEYYERRAFGKHIDASRLFLYKVTRNLLGWTGDTGAFLRSTMGALVLFGVPPEQYWPYIIEEFDTEPTAFCYAFAQNYQAIQYFRLDPPGRDKQSLLEQIKKMLAHGLPAMFGFTVYSSISSASADGCIPYPAPGEKVNGGHAVVAVGYDDAKKITTPSVGHKTTGAFLIRNSWGESWGDKGYGWLPYDYVLNGLAIDWWSLIKSEWIDTGEFKL